MPVADERRLSLQGWEDFPLLKRESPPLSVAANWKVPGECRDKVLRELGLATQRCASLILERHPHGSDTARSNGHCPRWGESEQTMVGSTPPRKPGHTGMPARHRGRPSVKLTWGKRLRSCAPAFLFLLDWGEGVRRWRTIQTRSRTDAQPGCCDFMRSWSINMRLFGIGQRTTNLCFSSSTRQDLR